LLLFKVGFVSMRWQALYLAAELQEFSKNLRAKLWLMNEAIAKPPTPLTSPQKLFGDDSASSGSFVKSPFKKRPLE
jgi:hypothetical protein